ncbi:HotDog domain-containing protein [Crassisporium funariophilum]|nr:HotDog domain-containing protein [Crassisporium funariophilum]
MTISKNSTLENSDVAHIAGNASVHIKRVLSNTEAFYANRFPDTIKKTIFCEALHERFKVTEVSITEKVDEPRKKEGRVVVELDVMEDMLNGGGSMHGGCTASLIDMCSTLALHALVMSETTSEYISVSQTMNIVYHSPAQLGDKLRLVNTTLTVGARAHSVRTEVWNATHHRLVASGSQIKMVPSAPVPRL